MIALERATSFVAKNCIGTCPIKVAEAVLTAEKFTQKTNIIRILYIDKIELNPQNNKKRKTKLNTTQEKEGVTKKIKCFKKNV